LDQGAGPFRAEVDVDFSRFREALRQAGYTMSAVAGAYCLSQTQGDLDRDYALRRLPAWTPFATLVRLFALAGEVPLELAESALAPMPVAPLVDAGLLRVSGQRVYAVATLLPYEDLFFAHDHCRELTGAPLPSHHVVGAGRASLRLAALTRRRRVASAVDIGTGSGFQAVLAAKHAERVLATDLNPRALNFTQFNARLNGLPNVETARGSLFEPIRGRQFDLIVANPPYVISPDTDLLFRDGGQPGDAISRQTVEGVARHLNEGGFGSIICNWCHDEPDQWSTPPLRWLQNAGCDVWIIRIATQDRLNYAVTWLRGDRSNDETSYSAKIDSWLEYYDRLGVQCVTTGVVIVRRSSRQPNWSRCDDLEGWDTVLDDCDDQIARVFAGHDLLRDMDEPTQLLDYSFALTADHELVHTQRLENGQWVTQSARIRQNRGLGFVGNVDSLTAGLLAQCNGHRSLRELVLSTSRQLGLDESAIGPRICQLFASLLRTGFLTVVAQPS
jgi:methylase of polypeptide subunit release factors